MKVRIFQPNIRAYRVPLFNSISDFDCVESCVLLYGDEVNETTLSENYKSVYIPAKYFRGFCFQHGLSRFAKDSDVNVVPFDLHCVSAIFWAFWYRKSAKFVLWGHGLGRSKIAAKIKVFLASKAASIVVYGFKGKAELVSAGVNPDKIHVAVNTMFVPNSKDCSGCEKEYFLYVGRLQKRKNLKFMLEAFSLYKDKLNGKYNLIILGDGEPEKTNLEEKCRQLGIAAYVSFQQGTVDDEKLAAIYSKAAAYLSPGHVGLGVLHSFSYGVPVLTIKDRPHAPEHEWIIDGVNGYLTEDSLSDYSKSLKTLDYSENALSLGHKAFFTYSLEAGPEQMLHGFKKVIYEKR